MKVLEIKQEKIWTKFNQVSPKHKSIDLFVASKLDEATENLRGVDLSILSK